MSHTATVPPPSAFDDAEPPPAYAPTPAEHLGESTVELGPRRPFTSATGIRLQPVSTQVTGSGDVRYVSPTPTGSTHGGFAGGNGGFGALSSAASPSRLAPPPRHPSLNHRDDVSWRGVVDLSPSPSRARRTASPALPALPPRPSPPMSDFAADFYAAGAADTGALLDAPAPTAGGDAGSPRARSATPSASVERVPEFAPPPGLPPVRSATTVQPRHSRAASSGSGQIPDDGKPTTTPVPGHPLLLAGQLLVYPAGYNCSKCSNTGYKHADPSHPCRRCWRTYAQPYTGAITYAPTDSSVPSLSGKTFQRPLPNLRPPQRPPHQPSPSVSSLPSPSPSFGGDYPGSLGRARTACTPRFEPAWGSFPPRPAQFQPWRGFGAPPPGATVVMPGDPRIGGRPCWRCDGTGTVSFLLFDRETCPTCGGIGRVF